MISTPLGITDELMSLRAKSWRLAKREDELLTNLQSVMTFRSQVDERIDELEKRIGVWKKGHEPEPTGFFGWVK